MNKKFLFIIFLLGTSCFLNNAKHAITYDLGGGRFGDKILGYIQASYLGYLASIPLLYRPFDFSDQLTMDQGLKLYDRSQSRYSRRLHINSNQSIIDFFTQIRDHNTPPTLFIVDYFPSDTSEWDGILESILPLRSVALIPWSNSEFSIHIKNTVKPRIQIPNFRQENCLNVAVHIRTLSGGDSYETSHKYFPLKHPRLEYYASQIRRVYEFNLNMPIHVFIFSDSQNPQSLLEYFNNSFSGVKIHFDIQNVERPDLNTTVQDFFAMQQFDVLIATQSNFSMLAARLGNFDMIIFPIHHKGEFPNYMIDKVQVISKKSSWFPYELNTILRNYT